MIPMAKPKYVTSYEQFLEHSKAHIQNVKELSNYCIDKINNDESHRELFNVPDGINLDDYKDVILEAISIHDKAKLSTVADAYAPPHLREMLDKDGTQQRFVLSEMIYLGYGENFMLMDEQARDELKHVVINGTLNDRDTVHVQKFMDEQKLPQWLQKFIKDVEKTADQIDRGKNPISEEEFGRPMKLASKFTDDGPAKAEFCRQVESVYNDIASNTYHKKRILEMNPESGNKIASNNAQSLRDIDSEHIIVEELDCHAFHITVNNDAKTKKINDILASEPSLNDEEFEYPADLIPKNAQSQKQKSSPRISLSTPKLTASL